jgi:cell wall-associated NlpC family hydrolase
MRETINFLIILMTASLLGSPKSIANPVLSKKIISIADELLEKSNLSYGYGGYRVGSTGQCDKCNKCLSSKLPRPKKQLVTCPECKLCSLDCSHFLHWVFRTAGIKYRYLTTKTMLNSTRGDLAKNFELIDLGTKLDLSKTGDLLVYRDHVVMLVQRVSPTHGTIIHATGGRDLKGAGHGIQRERNALLANFRGPLLRVLRHRSLTALRAPPLNPGLRRFQPSSAK